MVTTVFNQVLTMFLLAGAGFVMRKTGKISDEGSKTLGNILIFLSLPCVIINGFMVERTSEKITSLLISAVFGLGALLIAMLVAFLFFRKDGIANFAASFSNPGFFGVPIIVAAMDQGAVFYVAAYIAFLNLLQWTYGVNLLNAGEKKSSGFGAILKRLIKAPFMVAIVIGLVFFFSGLRPPVLIGKCINYVAALNTPIAMFTIGIYLAQAKVLSMLKKWKLYLISIVKLILAPLIVMGIMVLFPQISLELRTCIIIAAACPVGSNICVYAQLLDKDHVYAVETVVFSTILSIASLPMILQIWKLIQ